MCCSTIPCSISAIRSILSRMWDGGMSFHGGFLGVVVACLVLWPQDRRRPRPHARSRRGLGAGGAGARPARQFHQWRALWGGPATCPGPSYFPTMLAGLPRHPSQLYEAALEGLVLFIAVRIATHRFRALAHPGRASGIFALGYGLSRIVVEFCPRARCPNRLFLRLHHHGHDPVAAAVRGGHLAALQIADAA